VQRATVYRHFPHLESLFSSCSAHWASLNPPPSPETWSQIRDPDDRLRHALADLYEWYSWAEPMLTNVTRDAPLVPACAAAGESFARHFDSLHEALMRGRRTSGRARARVSGAIGHALSFGTWRSLVREQRLTAEEAVELMVSLARTACAA
jgi:AcrR family transcriptional regulator